MTVKQLRICVKELFPPETLAARTATIDRFWHGEDIGRPVIRPVSWENRYTQIPDMETAVGKFLATLEIESQRGWDTVPAFACSLGPVGLASAFGGKVIFSNNPDIPPWIEPLVRNDPSEIQRLKPPSVRSGLIGTAIEQYERALERLDGYVPPRVPDMQGPLNTASMIWNQEDFLTALYTNPDEAHCLLGLVTDFIIEVFRYFRDTWKNAELLSWPFYHMPPELGVGITEDLIPLMQPELYEEFGVPYVNRISDAFGGVYIHCCGTFGQHWDAVKKIRNLRGMDTMYPNSHPEKLHAAFPGIVHNMGLSAQGQASLFPGENAEERFLGFYLEHAPRNMRFQFLVGADDAGSFDRQVGMILRHWERAT
jgi:hypothetical protein